MSRRITKANVERAFPHFVRAIGGRVATHVGDVGGLFLDYQGTYGGYVITHYTTETGGEGHPFGSERFSAPAMYDLLFFGRYAAEFALRVEEAKRMAGGLDADATALTVEALKDASRWLARAVNDKLFDGHCVAPRGAEIALGKVERALAAAGGVQHG